MVPYLQTSTCYILTVLFAVSFAKKLEVIYQWKQVDFTYPNPQARENAIRSNKFIPENCLILDVDVWQPHHSVAPKTMQEDRFFFNSGHISNNHVNNVKPRNEQRVFVTVPRFKGGIPVTLATVSDQKKGDSYLLAPFPNWAAQREGNCDGVTSVYRTTIDKCGRLWVIDSGKVNNFGPNPVQLCRPKVIAFDLNNGERLIGTYPIPDSQLEHDSLLITIAADVRGDNCADTFIYLADVSGYKLIVYDITNNASWRVSSNYFYPFPTHGHFNIAGTEFNLMDGLLALALGPVQNNDRYLYFHSLASVHEGSVLTSILRNREFFQNDSDAAWSRFYLSEPVRSSQSAAEAMTDTGVMIFSLLSETALACWNSQTPYTKDNIHIADQESETLQFPGGLKIIDNTVWTATCELQNYITETTEPNDVKYRILKAPVDKLIQGTGCDIRSAGYLVHEIENKFKFNINQQNNKFPLLAQPPIQPILVPPNPPFLDYSAHNRNPKHFSFPAYQQLKDYTLSKKPFPAH